MDRVHVFVDTSYLLASFYNSWQTGARAQLEIDLPAVVDKLGDVAERRGGVPVQRQLWYDGVPDSGPHRYQRTLRRLNGVQLRSGQLIEWGDRRTQKGVDTLLVADMVLAAVRQSCTDIVLVSGDADMIPGVQVAVDHGVRVHLIGFGWDSMSAALRHACDTMTILDPREEFEECMHLHILEGPLQPTVRTDPSPVTEDDDTHHRAIPDALEDHPRSTSSAWEDEDEEDSGENATSGASDTEATTPETPSEAPSETTSDTVTVPLEVTGRHAGSPHRSTSGYPRSEGTASRPRRIVRSGTSSARPTDDAAAAKPTPSAPAGSPSASAPSASAPAANAGDEGTGSATTEEPTPDTTRNSATADTAAPGETEDSRETGDTEGASESTAERPRPRPRPLPSMMAPKRKPLRSRYVPLPEEVWTTDGEQTPFDVGQQYAMWWFKNAASDKQRDEAHLLTGGPLPHDVDRPLLQFACETLHEFTLSDYQRVSLRDGFHTGLRQLLLQR